MVKQKQITIVLAAAGSPPQTSITTASVATAATVHTYLKQKESNIIPDCSNGKIVMGIREHGCNGDYSCLQISNMRRRRRRIYLGYPKVERG